jgi:ClpA/ClpB-like protein
MWDRFYKTSDIGLALKAALEETRRRGDRKLGTDHLLLGLLHQTGPARTLGVSVSEGRAALADLDRVALAAIGLDLTGLHLPDPAPTKRSALTRNTLTAGTRAVLTKAIDANGGKTRGLTTKQLLRSVLACPPTEPAAQLLTHLHIDASAARARLDETEGL